jgi:pimeloyl-ACP methyl ester carboxylesterase
LTIEVMAADTLALLDHLGIDQAHILGYSLGGLVAQEIAISHPERVKKLILVSTLSRGGATEDVTIVAQRALGPERGQRGQGRHALPTLIDLSFNRWPYRAALGLVARLFAGRIRPEGLAGQMEAAASANTLDRLGSIRAKTLVLTGTEDRLIDPAASKLLASRIPQAKLVMIEGGSHAMAIEMRGEFNAAVLHFLRDD